MRRKRKGGGADGGREEGRMEAGRKEDKMLDDS